MFGEAFDSLQWVAVQAAQTSPGSTTWTAWRYDDTSMLGGQIGAGIDPDGRVELFTRDVTGNLVHRVQLMPGWGASDWTGWGPWKPVTEAGVLN